MDRKIATLDPYSIPHPKNQFEKNKRHKTYKSDYKASQRKICDLWVDQKFL